MVSLILDIVVVALLLMTLGGGLRLHGALKTFRVDSDEFRPMVQALDEAAERAERTLKGLRQMAEEAGAKLSDEADSTQRLIDELGFMTKRADQLAEQLDDGISQARAMTMKTQPTANVQPAMPRDRSPKKNDPRRRPPDLEQRLKQLR